MSGISYSIMSAILYNSLSDKWMQYLTNWHVCCCLLSHMKSSLKLLLVLTAAITFSVAQPVKQSASSKPDLLSRVFRMVARQCLYLAWLCSASLPCGKS